MMRNQDCFICGNKKDDEVVYVLSVVSMDGTRWKEFSFCCYDCVCTNDMMISLEMGGEVEKGDIWRYVEDELIATSGVYLDWLVAYPGPGDIEHVHRKFLFLNSGKVESTEIPIGENIV